MRSRTGRFSGFSRWPAVTEIHTATIRSLLHYFGSPDSMQQQNVRDLCDEVDRLRAKIAAIEELCQVEIPNQVSSYRQGQINMLNRIRKILLDHDIAAISGRRTVS